MATYYLNGDTGDDGTGDGSSSLPWATLAKLDTVMAANDTAYLAGTFRPDALSDFRDLTGIKFLRWDGQAQPIIRGDTVITGWTNGVNVYTKALSAGLNIKSVVVDWDTNIDASGRHYGHLFLAANAAAVAADNDSWFYDSITGLLTIRIGADLDPAGFTVARCIGGVNGLVMGSTSGVATTGHEVQGLWFYLWCDGTSEFGYGLRMYTCQGSRVSNCRAFDCGYHATGWTNNNGAEAIDNIESGTLAMGLAANGDSSLVMYANTGTMRNCRMVDCTVHLYPFLGRDGAPILLTGTATTSVLGIACHAADPNTNIEDAEIRDCSVICYTPTGFTNRQQPYRTSHSPNVAAADRMNPWAYPIRLVNCTATNGARMILNASAAFIGCSFSMDQAGPSGAAAAAGAFGDNADIVSPLSLGFFGCDLRGSLDGGAVTCWLYCARGDTSPAAIANHTLVNCTLYNFGTSTDNNVRGIFNHNPALTTSGANIVARGCIFGHRQPTGAGPLNNLTHNNGSATPATMDFKDCRYVNISTTRYSSNASYDTLAEWTASIDPNGVYDGTSNPIADVTGAGGGALLLSRARVKFLSGISFDGVNGRKYSGHYGAWQYGASSDRLGRSMPASSYDVAGALIPPRRSWSVR